MLLEREACLASLAEYAEQARLGNGRLVLISGEAGVGKSALVEQWSWCISGRPDRGPAAEQARQVRLLADAYGLDDHRRRRLVRAIDERLDRNVALWRAVATGPPGPVTQHPVAQHPVAEHPDARRRADEVVAWTRSEQRFVAEHTALFAAALNEAPIA
jgi:hypothetical protein